MIKGGYQIIDLLNIELDDTPYLFDGLYDRLKDNNNKVCLLSNINVEDIPFKEYYVQPIVDEDENIKCTIGDKTFIVSSNDYVYIVDGIIGGGGSQGTSDYTDLTNKPQINGNTLTGNKNSHQLGLQTELIPGDNIQIDNDGTISATDTSDYDDLEHLPQINGETVSGHKLASDFGLQNELTAGSGISIVNDVISATGGGSSNSIPTLTIRYTISTNLELAGNNKRTYSTSNMSGITFDSGGVNLKDYVNQNTTYFDKTQKYVNLVMELSNSTTLYTFTGIAIIAEAYTSGNLAIYAKGIGGRHNKSVDTTNVEKLITIRQQFNLTNSYYGDDLIYNNTSISSGYQNLYMTFYRALKDGTGISIDDNTGAINGPNVAVIDGSGLKFSGSSTNNPVTGQYKQDFKDDLLTAALDGKAIFISGLECWDYDAAPPSKWYDLGTIGGVANLGMYESDGVIIFITYNYNAFSLEILIDTTLQDEISITNVTQ